VRRFVRAVLIVISICVIPAVRAAGSKVAALRIVLVSSRDDLRRSCRFAADLYACTAFESRRLEAACVAAGAGQWAMIANANVQPVVYLWDARWLGHERLHISDVETALGEYVDRLERHRFESESDCRRAAAADTGGFARQIDIFAAASNDLRHYKHTARNHAAK
jgi:hypothetical protein